MLRSRSAARFILERMATAEQTEPGSSDLSLAIRLRDGSSDAWRELVDLYGPLIDSWCRRCGLTIEAARADVGQEVFLAVHRGIARFDPTQPHATFRGWLWTIAHNAIFKWHKKHDPPPGGSTAQQRLAEIPDHWEVDRGEEPSTPDESAALLRRALDQIRPTIEPATWEAFWQTTVLGRSAPEVASELGLTPAAVRQAKSRTLRRLRRQLGDR
jgi:RNA polymerase sigma-70 factor (ECF subfamily)